MLCCRVLLLNPYLSVVIEIPGYRIDRPLGRGGMSTVYLALQESVQREVALKIMSGTLLGDEEFGERFLREARIAASLRHPNVVHLYDVGRHEDHHYMAMEHLPGGPVLTRRGPRRDFAFARKVVREIASALDYAHRRGVVHRDIKPDNILLREDGSAVLTDFGIARAGDSMRMTRTGAIIGTPHYMSPEQARGLPLDGRADLYSLGVVLYQLVRGEVPYQADDSVAVGIMHITAPLPRLPESLAVLQPLFDRLLAKDPAQRFESGQALAEALDRLSGLAIELPEPAPPRGRGGRSPAPLDTPTVVTTPDVPAASSRERHAHGPVLGAMESIGRAPDRRREPPARRTSAAGPSSTARRSRKLVFAAGAALLAVLLAGYVFEDRLRALWTSSSRTEQLQRAEQALAAGRLQDDGSGPGARSLYNAILAVEPDHEAAREGLRRVGRGHLESARAAAADGRVAEATAALGLARGLGVGAAELAEVESLLQNPGSRDVAEGELAALVDAAALAVSEGRIEEPDTGALALYQRALALEPNNPVARAGLRDALAPLIQRARAHVEAGAFVEAERLLAAVTQIDPSHLELPELKGRLAEARKGRDEQVEVLLRQARQRITRGEFTAPAGGSARDAFTAVLALEPEHAEAREALRRMGADLLRRADAAMADFDFPAAESALDSAALLAPPPQGLAAARKRMEESRARYQRLPSGESVDPVKVAALIAAAEAAIIDGRLLQPPGESAFDSLRAALRIEPGNARARELMDSLAGQARQRFDSAMSINQPNRALRYFEGLQVVAPADAALPSMRQRLAAAFVGLATERLGRGETAPARQALERAAELEPNNTELPALRARLEQAGG